MGLADIANPTLLIIEELIKRETYDAPTFHLNPDVHDFYQFTRNDVSLDNYITGPQVLNIPVAI